MTFEIPYFMTNEKWFYFDAEKKRFELTSLATDEAQKSYDEFYKALKMIYLNS